MLRTTVTCLALLIARTVSAQSLPPVTEDPAAARHTMVQAAGMPLNDGALPPGILTVRVVRGAFTANLPGETVAVDIVGGRQETARTGSDGRAQFAHLPVGAQVRASAIVANQRLTSDLFVLPADSGVRVLLVVDDGAAVAPGATSTANDMSASAISPQPTALNPVVPRRGPSRGVLAIRILFTIATLAAFAIVLFRQTTPRPRRTRTSH